MALWSHTKAAVNTGYGMPSYARIGLPNPFYKPRPLGAAPDEHPERLFDPPYGWNPDPHLRGLIHGGSNLDMVRGGSFRISKDDPVVKFGRDLKNRLSTVKLVKRKTGGKTFREITQEHAREYGKELAKTRFGKKLRNFMNPPKKGGKALLSRKRMKGGDGLFGMLGTMAEAIGATSMNVLKNLALQAGSSVMDLLATIVTDPKKALSLAMKFAPGAISVILGIMRKLGLSTPKIGKRKKQKRQTRPVPPTPDYPAPPPPPDEPAPSAPYEDEVPPPPPSEPPPTVVEPSYFELRKQMYGYGHPVMFY